MNILKERKKSELLRGLDSLNSRFNLPIEVYRYYQALKSGLEGEMIFDSLIEESVKSEGIILNDLLLSVNGSTIQIDSLLLTPEMIYLYEIKNYRGSYVLESDHYRKVDGFEIPNPKNQLNKTLALMSQLFKQWNVTTPLSGAVIFINSCFTLYGAVPDEQIVLPSQLAAYVVGLNRQKNRIPHPIRMLANRLIEHHQHEAPYQKKLPLYEWDELKKGLTCGSCRSFDLKLTQRSCLCNDCLNLTSRQENFLNNVEELKILYPNEKLTTVLVYNWLGGQVTKDSLKNSLSKHYQQHGKTKSTHYE